MSALGVQPGASTSEGSAQTVIHRPLIAAQGEQPNGRLSPGVMRVEDGSVAKDEQDCAIVYRGPLRSTFRVPDIAHQNPPPPPPNARPFRQVPLDVTAPNFIPEQRNLAHQPPVMHPHFSLGVSQGTQYPGPYVFNPSAYGPIQYPPHPNGFNSLAFGPFQNLPHHPQRYNHDVTGTYPPEIPETGHPYGHMRPILYGDASEKDRLEGLWVYDNTTYSGYPCHKIKTTVDSPDPYLVRTSNDIWIPGYEQVDAVEVPTNVSTNLGQRKTKNKKRNRARNRKKNKQQPPRKNGDDNISSPEHLSLEHCVSETATEGYQEDNLPTPASMWQASAEPVGPLIVDGNESDETLSRDKAFERLGLKNSRVRRASTR